jgi:hypothetical protein
VRGAGEHGRAPRAGVTLEAGQLVEDGRPRRLEPLVGGLFVG